MPVLLLLPLAPAAAQGSGCSRPWLFSLANASLVGAPRGGGNAVKLLNHSTHNELPPRKGVAAAKATSGNAEAHNNQYHWYLANIGLDPKRCETLIN
jgi:hypothetical protein